MSHDQPGAESSPSAGATAQPPSGAAIIAAALDAMALTDGEARVIQWNPAAERMFGFSREEARGRYLQDLIVPERLREAVRLGIAEAGADRDRRLEVPALRRDGSEIEVELTVRLVCEDPPSLLAQMREVREPQPAHAVAPHEWRYRTLLESLPDTSVLFFDKDLVVSDVHGAEGQGWQGSRMIGECIEDLMPRDRAIELTARYRRALSGEVQTFEWEGVRAAGRWFELQVIPVSGPDGSIAGGMVLTRDITERKSIERRIGQQAQILEELDAAVVTIGVGWHVTLWNAAAERMFGPPGADGDPEMLVFRDAALREEVIACARSGETWRGEAEVRGADGTWLPVVASCAPVLDEHGEVASVVGIAVDISRERATDKALRASEERFRTIVEASHDGIWTLDAENRTTFVNAQLTQLLGYSAEELLGRTPLDFVERDEVHAVERALEQRREGRADRREVRFRRKDGEPIHAIVSGTPLWGRDGAYAGSLGMVTDITERVTDEREREHLRTSLHHSQKLEGIGRLAGGVAHDFNNLLSVILNYGAFVEEGVADRPEVLADLREITAAAGRAAELTRQLLVFSRRDVASADVIDVADVIGDMEKLLRRTLGEHIELEVDSGKGGCSVRADRSGIEQIVLNLSLNSRDAMQGGGTLRISAGRQTVDELFARTRPGLVPGEYVTLTVEDSGEGMTADQVARAFEPFFTTKPPGAGTGLGLPTVYGIVTRSDGVVGIYSEPGHGTTVRVHIPAADAPVRPEPPAAPAKTAPGTGERVLLVEDEDAVRTLAARVLRRHGYEVLEAAEGEAALALEETAGRLDLLLTDLVMPGMSGKELADALRERQADVPVLFTSGYTDDALMRHGIRQEHVAFLGKPFTAADLLAKVRETLDRG